MNKVFTMVCRQNLAENTIRFVRSNVLWKMAQRAYLTRNFKDLSIIGQIYSFHNVLLLKARKKCIISGL